MARPKGSKNKPKIDVDGTPIDPAEYEAAAKTANPQSEKEKRWARLIDQDYVEDEPDRLRIPQHLIPDGMEYQWVTDKVFGQTFSQCRSRFEMKGWEAVPARRHDGLFTPKGFDGEIEVDGLVLMERPKILSDRAREADARRARSQVKAKEQQLRGGDIQGITLDTQHPNALRQNKVNKSYERIQVPEE